MVRLKGSRNKAINTLTLIFRLSVFIGPFIWGLYELFDFHLNIKGEETLATITGAFSFTMTGFLAGMAALMLAVSGKPEYKAWVDLGYGKLFVEIYIISLICLGVTFFSSLAVFIVSYKLTAMKLALSMLVTNLVQIGICTMIIIKRATKGA